MGASARKKSALERRLRDLEKERERVSGDIKVLSRALKKADDGVPIRDIPRLKTQPERPPVQTVQTVEPEAVATEEHDDLFSHATRPRPPEPAAPSPAQKDSGRPTKQKPARKVEMDQRLASYLTSGSFFPATPIKEDRNITRNKAVFMVIVVIIAAFVIYTLSQYL